MKITVYNRLSVTRFAGGHFFRPKRETEVEVTDEQREDIEANRALEVRGEVDDTPEWGGSVKSALEWVGDDKERANEVLEAERANGDRARKSLVSALEKITASTE